MKIIMRIMRNFTSKSVRIGTTYLYTDCTAKVVNDRAVLHLVADEPELPVPDFPEMCRP